MIFGLDMRFLGGKWEKKNKGWHNGNRMSHFTVRRNALPIVGRAERSVLCICINVYFTSDFVGGPTLGEGSTVNRPWAREQIWMKVPLSCLVLLQVLVLQPEPLLWQTMSTPAGVWAELQ